MAKLDNRVNHLFYYLYLKLLILFSSLALLQKEYDSLLIETVKLVSASVPTGLSAWI